MVALDGSPDIRSGQGSRVIRELIVLAGLVGAADVLLFVGIPYAVAAAAALFMAGFLPGILLVWLATQGQAQTIGTGERLLYGVGMGYALVVMTVMLISYLPGGVTRTQLLIVAHTTLLGLAVVIGLSGRTPLTEIAGGVRAQWPRWRLRGMSHPWQAAAVGVLLGTALILRFATLGYSEFQGDEAVVALRAVDVIQGYENALFTHLKGPAEILLPTLVFSTTGRLTEITARMPFALANVLGLVAFALLATRLLGFWGGWFSAMLLVVDGYLVAFGRIVQYQSLVFFMVVLAVLALQHLLAAKRSPALLLSFASLYISIGLLAHYDAVFASIPLAYVTWRMVREAESVKRAGLALLFPAALGVLVLASFYGPMLNSPKLGDTALYVIGFRVGGSSSLATLSEVWQRTALYDSAYAVLVVLALALVAEAYALRRTMKSRRSMTVVGVAWLCIISTYLATEATPGSTFGLIKLGVMLALAAPIASLVTPADERMIWWWLAGPVVVLLFYTALPGTHVYSIALPLALVAGYGAKQLYSLVTRWKQSTPIRVGAGVVAAAYLMIVFIYVATLFVRNTPEVLRTWQSSRPLAYWMPFDYPVEWSIFGFPLRNGWKTAGVLFSQGDLQGPYDANNRTAVAEWYLRGEAPCARDDPQTYLLAQKVEPVYADETEEQRRQWAEKHGLYRTVLVNDEPKLAIFRDIPVEGKAQELADAEYAPAFDRELSGIFERRSGPVGSMAGADPVHFRFGPDIELAGYRLDQKDFRPGEEVDVTLFWRTDKPVTDSYDVSVQVVNLADYHKAGQRDGEPVCNQQPTTTWIAGDLIADRYRSTLAGDAKPGPYSLFVVMYDKDGTVLAVTGADGKPVGQGATLTAVNVVP